MPELLFLLLIVVAGIVIFKVVRSKAGQQDQQVKPTPSDPLADHDSSGGDRQFYELKPGDLVKTLDGDFLVRGTISFDEGGSRWFEHLLDDAAGTKKWLAVEDDEGLELGLWERAPMADVESGGPGDRSVVIRGIAYKLVERGKANFTAVGSTGTGTSGSAEYIDYEASGGELMGFEKYEGGSWEVALGTRARPSDLDVYPSTQGV